MIENQNPNGVQASFVATAVDTRTGERLKQMIEVPNGVPIPSGRELAETLQLIAKATRTPVIIVKVESIDYTLRTVFERPIEDN